MRVSFVLILWSAVLFLALSSAKSENSEAKINRFELVTRHNVILNKFDTLNPLSTGNGKFAFTVDATGLQTFPQLYRNGIYLGTQSEWGWHSFPNKKNFNREETYQYFEVEGRQIPYSVQWDNPGRKQKAANYFRANPHRLHLGILGFRLLKENGEVVKPKEIHQVNQELKFWNGQISSSFKIEDDKIDVNTLAHPDRDLIAVKVNSERLKNGLIEFQLCLPYPDAEFAGDGADWNTDEQHFSEVIEKSNSDAVLIHKIDTTIYHIKLKWSGKAKLIKAKHHNFILKPNVDNSDFTLSVEFKTENHFADDLQFNEVEVASSKAWMNFWESGGAVDFSGTSDPRANELERRVVLSQYLMRVQCAGHLPPQETGLTYNSWYGKHHLEMHWWHGVHWAYWNRMELLEKSLDYYISISEKAKRKAQIQGYDGVRWPKMTGPHGSDSPSGVGEFLIWQQPHLIYYAELLYRHNPKKDILDKYAPLIFSTADFMADFARWDEENNRFILGPPLIPAQESLEKEVTVNPPFELVYWKWGLAKALEWRKRMQLPENEKWHAVIKGLPALAKKDGKYLAAESAPDSYENEDYYSDHPMVLGAFGMLPGTADLDTAVMANTFDYIEENWNWHRTWGWDYPMAAMCATRLGKPEQAVDLLLKDVLKNTYLKNGHNFQGNRLKVYLPGNGGLLAAVAMMCAGFEGNTQANPGFPEDWNVKWENLKPLF